MNVRAKVSSKGQVVIPKKIREDLGIVDGTEIEFVAQGGLFRAACRGFRSEIPQGSGRSLPEACHPDRHTVPDGGGDRPGNACRGGVEV